MEGWNGESISLWFDKWLFGSSLRSCIHGPILSHENDLKLSCLRSKDILRVISFDLPCDPVDKIRSITFSNVDDKAFFLWTKASKFSLKLALDSIQDTNIIESWIGFGEVSRAPKKALFHMADGLGLNALQ